MLDDMAHRTPQQQVAYAEALLSRARERTRKADAHRKITLGGLVIAAGADGWDEAEIVGALMVVGQRLAGPDGQARRQALRARGIEHLQHRKIMPR